MKYIDIEEADLKEILELIVNESKNLVKIASKCAIASQNEEIQELLSEDSMERYLAITRAICIPLKDYDYELAQLLVETDATEELGRLMQSWNTLGASTEAALQIYLAIYLSNYKDSAWGKWEYFNFESVKNKLLDTLNNLKDCGDISQNNKDTLKRALKDFLKSKQETTHLEQLNLKSLIAFYDRNVWHMDKDRFTKELNIIREYRNCIHPFKKRDIGEWGRLLHSLKFYCELIRYLHITTPNVDDYFDYLMDMQAEINSYYDF